MTEPTPTHLADRLRAYGNPCAATKDAIRTEILSVGCANYSFGHVGGKHATWAMAFEAAFGEPLETRERAKRKRAST